MNHIEEKDRTITEWKIQTRAPLFFFFLRNGWKISPGRQARLSGENSIFGTEENEKIQGYADVVQPQICSRKPQVFRYNSLHSLWSGRGTGMKPEIQRSAADGCVLPQSGECKIPFFERKSMRKKDSFRNTQKSSFKNKEAFREMRGKTSGRHISLMINVFRR